MTTGARVRIIPEAVELADLRSALEAFENLTGEICVASTSGECAVRLPEGVTVPGYSFEILDGEGRHYINVHWRHVEEVVLLVG